MSDPVIPASHGDFKVKHCETSIKSPMTPVSNGDSRMKF